MKNKESQEALQDKGTGKPKTEFRNNRTRGKRNSRGKFGKNGSRIKVGKEYNDTSYYMKNPTITDAFAKLPFNYIVGNPLAGLGASSIFVPAIFSYNVDWVASTQCSTKVSNNTASNTKKNLIDLVATIVYTKMRRANAGATNNIEHVDVIISNLMASIDILCNVHFIHRLFRVANTFSWKNRSIPADIFSDHWNIDYQDFIANQANYRGRFDTLVALAQTIRTLSNFPFIDAAKAQFSEIFKDTNTDTGREQLIVSAKPFHHIYDATGNETIPGGMVRLMRTGDVKGWRDVTTTPSHIIYTGTTMNSDSFARPYTVSNWLDILEAQIYALINDSDFNLIQADIEKAFGEQSGYIVIDPVREVEPLVPVYSGEFMTTFHNANVYRLPATYFLNATTDKRFKFFRQGTFVNTVFQVHNDDGTVEAAQDFGYWCDDAATQAVDPVRGLLDLESDSPSVEEIVISTRFKSFLDNQVKSNLPSGWIERHGLDPVVPATAVLFYGVAMSNFMIWGGNITEYNTTAVGAIKTTRMGWSNVTAYGDQFPNSLIAVEQHPIAMENGRILSELNNIRYLSVSEALPIQEACFLSLWSLPEHTNI